MWRSDSEKLSTKEVFRELLIALAALFAAEQLFQLLFLPAIRLAFDPGDAATILIRRTGIFSLAVLAYWGCVRVVEDRKVPELRVAPLGIGVGALSGAGVILLALGLLFAGGAYATTNYRGWQGGLWEVAGLIVLAATLEEIVFRGILFRILEKRWGTLPAMWTQSLVFALAHVENVYGRAGALELATTVVSVVLLGAFWTLVFVHSRNLWVSTANHAAWNFTIILFGVPLSGVEDWRGIGLFASEYRGPVWSTGGVFGPEASLVTMAIVAACVAGMLRWARVKHRIVVAARTARDDGR